MQYLQGCKKEDNKAWDNTKLKEKKLTAQQTL